MILTLMALAVLAASIILLIIYKVKDLWNDLLSTIIICLMVIGGLLTVIFGGIGLVENSSPINDQLIISYNEEVESLTADYNYISTIQDDNARSIAVVEYNNHVREFKSAIIKGKYLANNVWISWLNPHAYNDMDENIVDYIK